MKNPVFLTHIGIRQMLTWLPTWKAKPWYHIGILLTFFLPLQRVQNYQNERKIPIPKQIRAYYIFQGNLQIFSNIYASLFIFRKLQTNEKAQSIRSLLSAMFFLVDIRSNQFRVDLYRNSLSKMWISGNVFYVFEHTSPCHEINSTLGEYIFERKHFQETYFCELYLENCKFHKKYFFNINHKFNFTKTFLQFKTQRLIWPLF